MGNYNVLDEFLSKKNLFKTTLSDELALVWRLLTLREVELLINLKQQNILDDFSFFYSIFERCYQGDSDCLAEDIPLGILIGIGKLIFEYSSVTSTDNEKELLLAFRNQYQADSLIEYMKRVIYLAFDELTWETISNYTKFELLEKFVIAENIQKHKHLADPNWNILDLEKIKSSNESEPQSTNQQAIDFEKENQALLASGANTSNVHPADMDIEELAALQKRNKKTIDQAVARKLDSKIRR